MAIIKPAFLRPVEITASNNTFRLKLYQDGVGMTYYDFNLDVGVWGSVFDLAAGIAAEINATAGWLCTAEFIQSGDDLLIKFTLIDQNNNGFAPIYKWDEVYDLIGSASALEGNYDTDDYDVVTTPNEYYVTMTYRPSHMWIPIYQSADQNRFYVDQGEIFSGNMSRSGFLAGNQTGPKVYWRDLQFVNETAENMFISAATSARYETRSLETFVKECRSVNITDSGNPCARGFYFIPDWTDITTTCSNLHNDNGGINFDYSSGADTYVFCQMNSRGYSVPQASLPTTKTRYTTGFQIHTVDYSVSWTYYS